MLSRYLSLSAHLYTWPRFRNRGAFVLESADVIIGQVRPNEGWRTTTYIGLSFGVYRTSHLFVTKTDTDPTIRNQVSRGLERESFPH